MTYVSTSLLAGIYLSLQCAVSSSLLPSITLQPCTVPMADRPITLCCEAKNIHSATVTFSHMTENGGVSSQIASVQYPCQVYQNQSGTYNITCQMESSRSVYRLSIAASTKATEIWTCQYYGGTASYILRENQILTQDSGLLFVNASHNATLKWQNIADVSDFIVYSPQGQEILEVQNTIIVKKAEGIEYKNGTSEVVLPAAVADDNGTYVYSYRPGKQWVRNGVTLIILDKLDTPRIDPANVTTITAARTISGTLQCIVSPKGAGPYFYIPSVSVHWKTPTENAGFNASVVGDTLVVTNVKCLTNKSQPVFCGAREGSGAPSELQFYFPHQLCYYHTPTTTAPVPQTTETPDELLALRLTLVVVCLLLGWMILMIFIIKRRGARRGICGPFVSCFSDCRAVMTKCCRRTLCKRCVKDDYMDSDSDLDRYISTISRRDDSSEWSQIANVYSPGDTPVIRIPRVDENQNGRPPLPPIPQYYNNVLDIGDEGDTAETSTDNNNYTDHEEETSSVSGAEGVDRNTIIKEVEAALKSLKKSLSSNQQQVQVTRTNLVENLMDIYADPTIVDTNLHIKILGEEGSDWGGVTRDVFTTFWNLVTTVYFRGDSVYVPYLPPHKLEDMYKFRLLGRILSHSTAVLGYIPISIAKSSIMVTVLDTTEISEDVLLEDFLLFLDSEDRKLIQDGMEDFKSLSEDALEKLQDIFFRFDMGCVLREDTFLSQVLKMARMELVIKPRSLCELIRQGIPEVHFDRFWVVLTLEHLSVLYDRLKPTPNKVLACLRAESLFLSAQRQRVFTYFKDFIKTLSEAELEKLLQFMTGQSCVPKRIITVQFSTLSGAERRPVAHTCSFSIELPDTYESFDEFMSEMTYLMNSDILQFDIQ